MLAVYRGERQSLFISQAFCSELKVRLLPALCSWLRTVPGAIYKSPKNVAANIKAWFNEKYKDSNVYTIKNIAFIVLLGYINIKIWR